MFLIFFRIHANLLRNLPWCIRILYFISVFLVFRTAFLRQPNVCLGFIRLLFHFTFQIRSTCFFYSQVVSLTHYLFNSFTIKGQFTFSMMCINYHAFSFLTFEFYVFLLEYELILELRTETAYKNLPTCSFINWF